jgi:hypothetical protein
MRHIDKRTQTFFTILFPIILVAWNLSFDLGAFGTIFYRYVMTAWVFACITFITLIYLKFTKKTKIKTSGIVVLIIPILWPAIDFVDQHIPNEYTYHFIIFDYLLTVLTMGFAGYIFLKIVKFDIFDPLSFAHKVAIIIITGIFCIIGFLVGSHHYLFFECGHFQISGEYAPPNCYIPPYSDFRTFYRNTWDAGVGNKK